MRSPGGYVQVSAPERHEEFILSGGHRFEGKEHDTFSCGHCTRVVVVKPLCDPADMGGLCKQCMTLVCPQCYATGSCTPIEKRIAEMEDRGRFLRQMQEWA